MEEEEEEGGGGDSVALVERWPQYSSFERASSAGTTAAVLAGSPKMTMTSYNANANATPSIAWGYFFVVVSLSKMLKEKSAHLKVTKSVKIMRSVSMGYSFM